MLSKWVIAIENYNKYKRPIHQYQSAQPINVLPHELALETATSWDEFRGQSYAHFDQLKGMLDKKGSSYRE